MKDKETLEEAAERCFEEMKSLNPKGGIREFIRLAVNFGAKWQQERIEEDLREAYFSAIKSTGEGWNGEFAEGNNPDIIEKFSKGFQLWFEQFKKNNNE